MISNTKNQCRVIQSLQTSDVPCSSNKRLVENLFLEAWYIIFTLVKLSIDYISIDAPDFRYLQSKDKIGKDFSKKSKHSVSAKAVALISMSSTRLEPACAVIQNVVSIIAEQRSLRSCCFYRCSAALAAYCSTYQYQYIRGIYRFLVYFSASSNSFMHT